MFYKYSKSAVIQPRQTSNTAELKGRKKTRESHPQPPPPPPLQKTKGDGVPPPQAPNFPKRRTAVPKQNAHRGRSGSQRRPRARRRPPFLLSPPGPSGGSDSRRRLSHGSPGATTAASAADARPVRSQILPGLGKRARLLEGRILPHKGRLLHEGCLSPQPLLARAAAASTAAAAVLAVSREGVRGRRQQRRWGGGGRGVGEGWGAGGGGFVALGGAACTFGADVAGGPLVLQLAAEALPGAASGEEGRGRRRGGARC